MEPHLGLARRLALAACLVLAAAQVGGQQGHARGGPSAGAHPGRSAQPGRTHPGRALAPGGERRTPAGRASGEHFGRTGRASGQHFNRAGPPAGTHRGPGEPGRHFTPSYPPPERPGPERRGWHGDIRHFGERDLGRWHQGRWYHGAHGGRSGWWWIVGPTWYFYLSPVYPYPDPYVPAPLLGAPARYWYYCADPPGYYPYIAECRVPWRAVPAQPG